MSTFLTRDDLFSQVTPQNMINRHMQEPHGEFRPAPWLPVQWTQYDIKEGYDAYVISKGKVVAFDRQGFVVPAGLYYWADLNTDDGGGTGTTMITYTATDYQWKVIDITTGLPYATNGTTSYTLLEVCKAIVERGLVPEDVTTNPPSSATHCEAVIAAFISKPIGVALYDIYKYAGTPERGDQAFANYNKQHLVQFTTWTQMLVPHRVADSTSADDFDFGAISQVTVGTTAGDFPVAGEVWAASALAANARYAAMGVTASSPIAALALAQDEVAKNTSRTPISCDVDGVLERQKFSIADVKREGDWFLDEFPGIIIVHEDTVATLVAGSTVATFTYNYYAAPSAGTDVASAHRYAHFDGTCRPGDLVSCDKQSNFCVRNSGSDIFKNTITLGRVLYEISEPRGMLNKVKTAWNRAEMGATARMPGTATGGYTDAITLSSEVIADRQVVLTFNCL